MEETFHTISDLIPIPYHYSRVYTCLDERINSAKCYDKLEYDCFIGEYCRWFTETIDGYLTSTMTQVLDKEFGIDLFCNTADGTYYESC